MTISIEQSMVYPERWFLKMNGTRQISIQLTEDELKEFINEARRVHKSWKN